MKALLAILAQSRRQWLCMAAGILLGILVLVANMLLMAVSGWFIASMAVAGVRGLSIDYFVPAAAIRVLAIVRSAGRYAERLVTHEAGFRVLADLRVWLFTRLEPLAPAVLQTYGGGEVAGRLRLDIDSLESLYLRIVAPLAAGLVSMVIAVAFAGAWSAAAALVLLAFLSVAGLILPLCARLVSRQPGQDTVRLAADLRSEVTEGVQGLEELLLLGGAQRQAARVEELSTALVAAQQRLGRIGALFQSIGTGWGGIGLAVIIAVVGPAVTAGLLPGPDLVMLLLFSAAAFEAAAVVPGALHAVPAAGEAAARVLDLAAAKPPVPEPAAPVAPDPLRHDILISGCRSRYGGAGGIGDFSLQIAQGERVALTGPSGSGKSTIIEILLGFRAYGGSVRIGGVELNRMHGDDLRRMIAAVPQRPHLFDATIRANLLLARPDATDDQVRQALEASCLAAWVAALPLGLDTVTGPGGSAISGGEARRIALARALLKDSPILLLDEPTEGLDPQTERQVVGNLAKYCAGRTVLLVSHRPVCLNMASRVVCLGRMGGKGQRGRIGPIGPIGRKA